MKIAHALDGREPLASARHLRICSSYVVICSRGEKLLLYTRAMKRTSSHNAECANTERQKAVSFPAYIAKAFILATIAVAGGAQSYSQTTNSGAAISIELKNNSEQERQTKAQLERLLGTYDLRKYTFTRAVVIDEHAIPHSHPVLTLHTRHLKHDDELLSAYVHEQLHWYLDEHLDQTKAAEGDLRQIYPKVPVGYPDGANDEESTYLHLIDCYLEMEADRELLGPTRAADVTNFWAGDHYRWVYKTVINDESTIGRVIEARHLNLK